MWCSVLCVLGPVLCVLCSVAYVLCSVCSGSYSVSCFLCPVFYVLCSEVCAMRSVLYVLSCVLCCPVSFCTVWSWSVLGGGRSARNSGWWLLGKPLGPWYFGAMGSLTDFLNTSVSERSIESPTGLTLMKKVAMVKHCLYVHTQGNNIC